MTSQRPGCISAFAALQMIWGFAFAFGALVLLADSEGALAIGAILLAAFQMGVAIGLWRMQIWAWWATVIVMVLGSLGSLLNMANGMSMAFVGLMVEVAILSWFVQNKRLFGAPSEDGAALDLEVAPSSDGA